MIPRPIFVTPILINNDQLSSKADIYMNLCICLQVEKDFYCWMCHKEKTNLHCELCSRTYHLKCLGVDIKPEGDWVCLECEVS